MESERSRSLAGAGGNRPRLEGFELLERLGRGPRSEVWHARTRRGAEIALKIFSPLLAQRDGFLTLFEKETAALTALSHPNILGALDRGRVGSTYFLVTERMSRGSLREAMRSGPLPAARAHTLAMGVCDALDYAHRRALPHRNLVPENVFLDSSGRVRVADFGLTLLHGTGRNEVAPGDPKTDLHALASMLYELITGERPRSTYASLRPRIPGFSQRLDELLARALNADASARFGRAGELGLSLRLAAPEVAEVAVEDDPDAVIVIVKDKLINVTVAAHATADNAKRALWDLEAVLGQPGPWKIAYELGAVTSMDAMSSVILRLHVRNQRNIARVAFCSPRAIVRASLLVLGNSVRRVPWKIFAALEPMKQWIDKEAP